MSIRTAFIGLGVVAGLLLLLTIPESCQRSREEQALQRANNAQGKAEAHEEQAGAADAKAKDLETKLEASQADVDRLKTDLKALRLRLATQHRPDVHVEPAGGPGGEAVVDVRDETIAKQDEVIRAQDGLIVGLKAQNAALVVARDAWKATAEDRAREAAGLRVALDAQRHAQEASKWRHRVEGLVIGIGTGFISGRMTR